MSTPRKVTPDQIEVIDATGGGAPGERRRWPQGVRVIRAGPLGLLALPFLAVLLLLVPILLMLAPLVSLLFGRSVFRVFRWKGGHGWGGSR